MNKSFNDYMSENINNIFFEKEKISFQEYEQLSEGEKENIIFDDNTYYKKIPLDYKRDDIQTGLMLEIYKQLYVLNKKQSTIKDILIFFCIITVISIVITIL